MPRFLLLILLCFFSTVAWCQLNRHQVEAMQADINVLEQAVRKINTPSHCQEGIDLLTSLISRSEQTPNYSTTRLATFYRSRGNGYLKLSKYDIAITDFVRSIELLQSSGETGAEALSTTWYQLSLAYYYADRRSEAMDAANRSITSAIDYYGPWHSTTLDAYSLRSNYAGFYNMVDVALSDRLVCFGIIQQNVERNFTYLTAAERTAYWKKYLPETSVMFAFAHRMGINDGEFADALYNQQLLAKGLLLTAESSLQRTIDGDSQLAAAYARIRSLRKKASDTKSDLATSTEATLEADRLEREITSTANGIGQFMSFLRIHAEDVKHKLSPHDVAIEFVDYRVGKDSTMYAALIMSPQWQSVRFIPLAESHEIEQNRQNLAGLVWAPILQLLPSNVTNIYFAPSGLLYQIPIESHCLGNGEMVSDVYNLFRLSSTRWLVQEPCEAARHEAVLYGDLQYDTSVAELTADMASYPVGTVRSGRVPIQRGAGSYTELDPLPATKFEVESILQILTTSDHNTIHAESYMGARGTETSFKALSASRRQIIHLATHGFFDAGGTTADNALQNTGLFFAGADNKLMGETIPASVNDGILTAEEVSLMDLSGLDMLTLSACETGLGTISHDGVFGLQRGFKKAGARSILMSLWKVDDLATCRLMTEFYSNWIGRGMTKHDALEAAKRTIRQLPGYEDPYYWAAFILLDGLE